MNESKLHRPIWHTPSSGGSKSPSFCRSCGIRRGQPSSHPVHYADRDERGAWAIYCNRYGEWTATGLDFATADRYAKANESGSEPCGCEPQPTCEACGYPLSSPTATCPQCGPTQPEETPVTTRDAVR